MELNFEQVNGAYVASVKVDSAYALHLERAGRCPLAVLQRHGEAGQYVPCPLPAVTGSLAPAVVDVALDHCVYPVEVKIVSGLEPHVSTLTPYAGGGGGGGIPDAPQDGVLYGRKDGTWSAVPDPSGDIADLQGRMDTAEGDIDALQQADTAQDGRLDTAEGEIDALEARMDPIEDKVEAMPAAYTLDSSLFHITDESTSEQIRDALEASGGFDAIVGAIKRGDSLNLHYSGEGWDGTYTESGINLVYGYVIEDDNGTTNLCLYFTRKNNIDVYDIYHDPDDDTYSARNWDYDLSVLDSDEYPLSTLGQKYQQLEASQAQQDEKITALETADTAQDEKITALEAADTQQDEKIEALETASAGHDEAIGELETKVEGLEAGGGFPEAPADGKTYGRKDKVWAAVPDPSADIAALEGRMDTAEGDIAALETADTGQDEKITALETADAAHDENIAALEASQTAQDEKIAALEQADTELSGRIDTAETDIEALETANAQQDEKIAALETADTELSGRIDTAETDIAALETSDAEQNAKITALEQADTELSGRIDTAETDIAALQAAGGIPEAPKDGQTYGRQNGAWTPVSDGGGGGIPEAPNDGRLYGRQNGAWSEVPDIESMGGLKVFDTTQIVEDFTPILFVDNWDEFTAQLDENGLFDKIRQAYEAGYRYFMVRAFEKSTGLFASTFGPVTIVQHNGKTSISGNPAFGFYLLDYSKAGAVELNVWREPDGSYMNV